MKYATYGDFVSDVKRRRVKTGEPQVWTATFTPKAMLECAEHQFRNRKPLRANVKHFCNTGLMGTYTPLLCDTVKFALDSQGAPRLVDGQNRLLGLGAAGKHQDIMVAVGVPAEAFASMDQGVARTVQHVLQSEGAENAAQAAYLVKRLDAYAQLRGNVYIARGDSSVHLDFIRRPTSVIDNAEVPELFAHYRDDINAATGLKLLQKYVRKATFRNRRELAAAYFLTMQANPVKAGEFWNLVLDDQAAKGIPAAHPASWLRDALSTEQSAFDNAALARWGNLGLGVRAAREKLEPMDAKLWQLSAAVWCYNRFARGKWGKRVELAPVQMGWEIEVVEGAHPADISVPAATQTRYANMATIATRVEKVLERFGEQVDREVEDESDE